MEYTVCETTAVSAFSDRYDSWHSIDWNAAHRAVRRTQVRIAEAVRAENWRKVSTLQRQLTRSFYGRALAVRRVTENVGKRTPGVDGVTWSTPQAKWQAIHDLKRRGYRPKPLRRVFIPKANGKTRPLGIPTMCDRAMQALHLLALLPVSETTADRHSFGFRPERATADAREQAFNCLSRKGSAAWVLEGDIEGCFDHIDHEWLLSRVRMDKGILRKWLKAGVVDKGQLFPTTAGTPQGGIISPTLANIALDGLDTLLDAHFGKPRSTKRYQTKVHFVRYADDFIITGISKAMLADEVLPLVRSFMAERGLRLSPEKTKITHIDTGFDFLGWNFRKYSGKLLIKPSKKNCLAYLTKLRAKVKNLYQAPQAVLIRTLNPIIRGWTNYHQHTVAKDSFDRADHLLWVALWRWARRRHPNKSRHWVKSRYFHTVGTRHWVFAARSQGDKPGATLLLAADTPIRRHVMIRLAASPFNRADEAYYEARLSRKMVHSLHHRRRLRALYVEQGGRCSHCKQPISRQTGWHVHHIVPRVLGGSDQQSNRVLLHPTCHNQVHNLNLSVTKLVPN